MIIKYNTKNEFKTLIEFYKEQGFNEEIKHEAGDLGVFYANEPYKSIHVSSIGYADSKHHQYIEFKQWLLMVVKGLVDEEIV